MKPLRVTITLASPMMEPGHAFHLDALLAALKVKQEGCLDTGADPRACHHDLPLERYQSPSGEWVFKASAFTFQKEIAPRTWLMSGGLNATLAAEHRNSGVLKLGSNKPNPAGGHFKGSVFYKSLLWTELVADCVGDAAGLQELLDLCDQVGAKRGTGFGRVKTITVDPVSLEECQWARRVMPADFDGPDVRGYARVMSALQPPYWDRSLHQPALMPLELVGS